MGYPFISIHIDKCCHFYKKIPDKLAVFLLLGK